MKIALFGLNLGCCRFVITVLEAKQQMAPGKIFFRGPEVRPFNRLPFRACCSRIGK